MAQKRKIFTLSVIRGKRRRFICLEKRDGLHTQVNDTAMKSSKREDANYSLT